MPALPADTLRNRTFVGLLIAQFLAAFNDQAIHAAAMFFAINRKTLTAAQAISLMPILFYAPWALFVTLAGYFADRFSKRSALIFWKVVEIAIMAVATLGFWMGTHGNPAGAWVVLACVFLMGMHSAFFVPAKYGAMPEILQPQHLSRGNGLLESFSFLAIILGTVCGGLLSDYFDDENQQYYIGAVLFGLAIIGAAASFLIERLPPANRHRPFPPYIYRPLWDSLRTVWRSRPLTFAFTGIAFFTFLVAFMRATVYMLGESQNPPWSESWTSIVVGFTSVGIFIGAPLAGVLSGRKVELGLVAIGAAGMTLATVGAALAIDRVYGLVACIIAIGFCTGFYLVPLFTLLQHRAPKTSKGEIVATNNFVNVIGAIAASVMFFLVVFAFQRFGLAEQIVPADGYAAGAMTDIQFREGVAIRLTVETDAGPRRIPPPGKIAVVEITRSIPAQIDPDAPPQVVVARYAKKGTEHYLVRTQGEDLAPVFDNSHLPQYLFVGAGAMALLTLGLLWFQMPDLFSRAGWVLRSVGAVRLRAFGTDHVPASGRVILATNCRDETGCRNVTAATERSVRFIRNKLSEEGLETAIRVIRGGTVLALAADVGEATLAGLQARVSATVLPVYYGPGRAEGDTHLRVAFGPPLPRDATPAEVAAAIERAAAMPEDLH
ncbi:MAG TPA: MFS transporter [Gemmataceae bacterium]|nr:MFS transporter [Gemmataceae bacterium]